jgi:hypothetical protein
MRLSWQPIFLKDETGVIRKYYPSVPVLMIEVAFGGNKLNTEGIVDSGASGLMLSKPYADRLGINLEGIEPIESTGVAGSFLRYPVDGMVFSVIGTDEHYDVEGSFTDIHDELGNYHPVLPLLGINSVFANYKVTIDTVNRTAELEPY